jgi:hypothetical protein
MIGENDREKQRKIIKYNHLVSNCLIFYNGFALSRVLHDYTLQGNAYEEEVISDLSPYLTTHVNRFGKYRIDPNRRPPELAFDVPIVQKGEPTLSKNPFPLGRRVSNKSSRGCHYLTPVYSLISEQKVSPKLRFLEGPAESAIVVLCKKSTKAFHGGIGVSSTNGAFTNSFRWSNIKNSTMAKNLCH